MKHKNDTKSTMAKSTDTPKDIGEYCSFPKAAKLLGVGVGTVRTLAKSGTLKTFTFGKGMHRRVLLASVRDLIAKKARD